MQKSKIEFRNSEGSREKRTKFSSPFKIQKNSFTFLELTIAVAVLAIGIISVLALSSKSFKSISLQKDKLIAMNLVSEEIELIRNVRDENWLYTGHSDCNKDSNIATCSDGQIYEDNGDCDWRCGDESESSPQPTFKLDNHLQDLDYLNNASYNAAIDYTTKTCKDDGLPLKIDTNNSYQHNSGQTTIFKRLVSIKRDTDLNGNGKTTDELQVKVAVCWKEGDSWQEVSAEDHLYNWK